MIVPSKLNLHALTLTVIASAFLAMSSNAATFYVSFTDDENIGGDAFLEEDIVLVTGATITKVVDGTTLSTTTGEDLDALDLSSNGQFAYSFTSAATIPQGVGSVTSGEVIGYTPTAPSGAQFALLHSLGLGDVDAYANVNGVPYFSLSANSTANVGSNALTIKDDEVFTLVGGIATSVFDAELAFGIAGQTSTDVDAFAITETGKFLFSTSSSNSFLPPGGVPAVDNFVRDGGVIYIYDPANPASFNPLSTSSIFFDATATFGTGINIDALHYVAIPEPTSVALGLGGLVALAMQRRREALQRR